MFEHSPKILANEEKATNDLGSTETHHDHIPVLTSTGSLINIFFQTLTLMTEGAVAVAVTIFLYSSHREACLTLTLVPQGPVELALGPLPGCTWPPHVAKSCSD